MAEVKLSTPEANEKVIDLLAEPANCGLLVLIDQLVKKAKDQRNTGRIRSCSLAENLLVCYQKSKITVTPTREESPTDFVQTAIEKAVEISSHPEEYHGILRTFAATFLSYLSNAEDSHKLIHAWKDFATHWLREEIHRTAREG